MSKHSTYRSDDFDAIENEYMSDESEICQWLRSLSVADRRLMILYAETGSLRETARIYNMSHGTVRNRIVKIKEQMK